MGVCLEIDPVVMGKKDDRETSCRGRETRCLYANVECKC